MALKLIAIVLSLGLDTLVVSLSVGMSGNARKRFRIAMVFACAEALMPLIGLFIGRVAGHWLGAWTSLAGGITLLCVALWMIVHDDDDAMERLDGFALVVTALSISMDELAVGFSFGLLGLPVIYTVIAIAAQAFLFTIIGITAGRQLRWLHGEWAEKAAGILLALLSVWILIESVRTLIA